MLFKSFASNGQVIKVGVDFLKMVFLNKFVYWALEGKDAVGNTKRQPFVLKKLTISYKGGVVPFFSWQRHLVIRQLKVNWTKVLVMCYSVNQVLYVRKRVGIQQGKAINGNRIVYEKPFLFTFVTQDTTL